MKEPKLKKKNVINRIFKKQFFVTICTVFLLIFILVGSSYALLNASTETGLTDVMVQSGNLLATISSESEMIELNYTTLGVSDEIGLTYDPYTFTVTNSGESTISYYELRIVDKEYEISTLPHKSLNFVLAKNNSEYTTIQNLGDNKSYIYAGGSLAKGESDSFSLKLWVNEEFGEYANNKVLKASIELTLYSEVPTRNYIIYDTQGGNYIPKTNASSKRVTNQVPTKEGYSFAGWSSSANGSVDYESNAIYDRTNGTILYAVWGLPPKAVETIKSKLGTDGLVAVNTDGALASEGDVIREYRYSGSAKYCTYTVDDVTYSLAVEGDTCPNVVDDGEFIYTCKETVDDSYCTVVPNQTTPIDGEVDNYIWFNNEMWRIIGVFKETTGAGTEEELVKIVREVPLTNLEVPETYTYNGTEMTMKSTEYEDKTYAYMYWNRSTYFSQTNYNDWTKAATQYYLNDETSGANSYYNSIDSRYQSMIETVQYDISNVDYGGTASVAYAQERSGNKYAGNQATWNGKIGMMYLSDYAYAAESGAWSQTTDIYGHKSLQATLSNWMNDNTREREWTMTPSSFDSRRAMKVNYDGTVYDSYVVYDFAVSPVLYLKSDVLITGGNGSEEKPYQLKMSPVEAVKEIKSKVGTDGLVAVNTDGALANEGDEIREYRYSGSAKYCTYTVDGTTYNLAVEGDVCPNAVDTGYYIYTCKENEDDDCTVVPNQTTPIDGEVDNYIWFNNEMWRIIGVFKETTGVETEKELVKIVREVPLTNAEVPETYTYNGTEMPIKDISGEYANYQYAHLYWNHDTYFNQINYNDWSKAATQYYLNDETSGANSYYNSIDAIYQRMVETVQYDISSIDWVATASGFYTDERSGNIVDENETTWLGKIGMIYPSDYAYAAQDEAWSVTTDQYGSKTQPATLNNWMNDNKRDKEWTMSPSYSDDAVLIERDGETTVDNSYIGYSITPVLYLKSDVLIIGGNGSEGNPYTLG